MATNFNWKGDWYKDRIKQAIFRGVYAGALVIQQSIKEQLNRKASNRSNPNGSPSAPGEPPAKMTGNLGRSIQLAADTSEPKVRIGTRAKYAKIHEYGLPIRAKKGKYLTIPISAKAKRASAQGKTAREAFGKKLFFVRSRRGGGVLVQNKFGKSLRRRSRKLKHAGLIKKTGELIIHYVCKESVQMPKRPFFAPGWMAAKQPALQKIKEVIQREMRRV